MVYIPGFPSGGLSGTRNQPAGVAQLPNIINLTGIEKKQ